MTAGSSQQPMAVLLAWGRVGLLTDASPVACGEGLASGGAARATFGSVCCEGTAVDAHDIVLAEDRVKDQCSGSK